MKYRSLLLALLLSVSGVCIAQAAKPGWSENFAEAKAQAAAQKNSSSSISRVRIGADGALKSTRKSSQSPTLKIWGRKS
jgi:hypothetical protein